MRIEWRERDVLKKTFFSLKEIVKKSRTYITLQARASVDFSINPVRREPNPPSEYFG